MLHICVYLCFQDFANYRKFRLGSTEMPNYEKEKRKCDLRKLIKSQETNRLKVEKMKGAGGSTSMASNGGSSKSADKRSSSTSTLTSSFAPTARVTTLFSSVSSPPAAHLAAPAQQKIGKKSSGKVFKKPPSNFGGGKLGDGSVSGLPVTGNAKLDAVAREARVAAVLQRLKDSKAAKDAVKQEKLGGEGR